MKRHMVLPGNMFEAPEDESLKHLEMEKVAQSLHDRLVDSTRLNTAGLQYVLVSFELLKQKQLERKCDEGHDGESGTKSA
jgi:hypothetical protein